MTPSEFQDQQANVTERQRQRERVIKLTREQYLALERAMQWPEDLPKYDRIATPTPLTEVQIGGAA